MLFHEASKGEKFKRKYLKYLRVYRVCLKTGKKPVIEYGKLDLKSPSLQLNLTVDSFFRTTLGLLAIPVYPKMQSSHVW